MDSKSNHSANSTNSCVPQNQVIKLVILWIIIVTGLIGNSLVIAVVKVIRGMRSTTNYLLVNVAIADNTTHLFTIFQIVGSRHRTSNRFLCKFIYENTISIVTLLVTAITLTLLAVERYEALMKPLTSSRRLTTDKIGYVIAGIWVTSLVFVTPLFVTLDSHPIELCSFGEAMEGIAIYIYCFIPILTVIPFAVIAFCYSQIIYGMHIKKTIFNNNGERGATPEEMREKKRLLRVLILLTVVFFAAFVPYGLLMILRYSNVINRDICRLKYWVQYLTLLNCSVNPIIYAFQSSGYRRGFSYILKKMTCRDTTIDVMELREMQTQWSVRSA